MTKLLELHLDCQPLLLKENLKYYKQTRISETLIFLSLCVTSLLMNRGCQETPCFNLLLYQLNKITKFYNFLSSVKSITNSVFYSSVNTATHLSPCHCVSWLIMYHTIQHILLVLLCFLRENLYVTFWVSQWGRLLSGQLPANTVRPIPIAVCITVTSLLCTKLVKVLVRECLSHGDPLTGVVLQHPLYQLK